MMKLSVGQFLAARGISVGKPGGYELGSLLAFVDRPLWIQMLKNPGCVFRMWPLRTMRSYIGSATTGSSSVQVRIGLSGFRSCFAEVALVSPFHESGFSVSICHCMYSRLVGEGVPTG